MFFHSTLDADDSGYLDLREFLLAIELVAARTPEEKLIWAFRQYDRDNSGQLDQAEMSKAMKKWKIAFLKNLHIGFCQRLQTSCC